MRSPGAIVALMLVASVGTGTADPPPDARSPVAARFEQVARDLPHLSATDLVYGRLARSIDRAWMSPIELDAFDRLAELPASTTDDDLKPLFSHPDARVRAVAVAVAALREDPHLLPDIVRLAADDAPTLPTTVPLALARIRIDGSPPGPAYTLAEQTVGDLARQIVDTYMEQAGLFYGIEGAYDHPGFAEYWNERRERPHCLSWFAVDLLRASQGTVPLPSDRVAAVRALRSRIDQLASPYGDLVLLWLGARTIGDSGDPGAAELVTNVDLIEAARRIGPSDLMRVLHGDPPTDDPDMRLRAGIDHRYNSVRLFVLQNATQLFQPSAAPALLALERAERERLGHTAYSPLVHASWAVAAADLRPDLAREILDGAFERFAGGNSIDDQDHRARLALAMLRHEGSRKLAFLADWFYGEATSRGAFGFGRHRFVDRLGTRDRPMIVLLVRDPRLDQLDWLSLERLVRALNRVAGEEVIREAELQNASHPLGAGHYEWQREMARSRYPDATERLERRLAGWRRAMRNWAE